MRSLRIYRQLLSADLRAQLQYPFAFVFELIASGLIMSMFFISLALVFQRFESIAGWSLGEVALLYGLVEMAFGAMDMIFTGFDPADFGERIRRGTFDQILLRPVSVTLQVFGSKFALRRISRIIQGGIILLFAFQLTDIHWTLSKSLYLPVIFFSLVLFFGGFFMAGSAITFWTVESIEAMNILTYGGSEMISYPMHIYHRSMRRFFTYVIPAIFLVYYPSLYILDKPDPLGMPAFTYLLSPLAGLFVFGFGWVLWKVGIRHYQGTGT